LVAFKKELRDFESRLGSRNGRRTLIFGWLLHGLPGFHFFSAHELLNII
jgi:hypothetical protein